MRLFIQPSIWCHVRGALWSAMVHLGLILRPARVVYPLSVPLHSPALGEGTTLYHGHIWPIFGWVNRLVMVAYSFWMIVVAWPMVF
jgi:hypothetical protein